MENPSSTSRPLRFEIDESDESLRIIILEPALDYLHARDSELGLVELLRDRPAVNVDLSAVRYTDEFGFETLIELSRRASGTVRFQGVCPAIRSLFILAHLDFLVEDAE